MDVLKTLEGLWLDSGFAQVLTSTGWKNYVMLTVAIILLYLGIKKAFEPLLLVGIAFGCLLTNLPGANLYNPELWDAFIDSNSEFYHSYGHILSNGGLLDILYIGVKSGVYPSLIFLGVGAMTDFGPLIANPKTLLLGAAAQLGVFLAFWGAIILGFTGPQAASIGIIGGADGPTAIFVTGFPTATVVLAVLVLAAVAAVVIVLKKKK